MEEEEILVGPERLRGEQMDDLQLKTIKEAAENLGVKERYLRRFIIGEGLLPIYRLSPRKAMVSTKDLDSYIESCKGYYIEKKEGGE